MDIYGYIKEEENRYNTIPIPVVENYEWHMARHVKLTTLYMNSEYETGNKEMKPFFNIVLPALNVQHRSLDFAIKDINFFVNDKDEYYKAFLIRKFHEKWARENHLAQFLDSMTETYTDYGGVLVKKLKNAAPHVVPFQTLAFCDQTDIMSGPICEKHQYSPDKLKEMEAKGWGDSKHGATATIDEVITLALNQKTTTQVKGRTIDTPNKYIEVYELHGVLPAKYLYDAEATDIDVKETDYVRQMQIIAFYQDHNGRKNGITLFKGKEKDGLYKFFKRDPVYGRALGRGGVEELFDAQVWENYSAIQQKELLDAASKVLYQTADKAFQTRNNTTNLEQGQILVHEDGKPLEQLNTSPQNIVLFEKALAQWAAQAKELSSSFSPFAATGGAKMSYRLGALLQKEASSLHLYRKSKLGGQFLPEIYKDWILPELVSEMMVDQDFSSDLSMDEMEEVSQAVVTCVVNDHIKAKILAGKLIDPGEVDALQQEFKQLFFKKGNQKFFKILAGEMKDLPIDMIVDVTQEEMIGAAMAEELTTIFSQLVPVLGANPQFFQQNPQMAKIFNEILANSGLNPLDIGVLPSAPTPASQPQPQNGDKPAPSPAPALPVPVATGK